MCGEKENNVIEAKVRFENNLLRLKNYDLKTGNLKKQLWFYEKEAE